MTTDRSRIIVGVDASSHAAAAAAWAAREAADCAMPLHLVNALNMAASGPGLLMPESFVEAGYAASGLLLNHLAAALVGQHPELRVTTETSEFGAPETLVAIGGDGDLIVTGTRGHGGFAGLLLGSVSLKTAVHAHCSTIVVRGHEDRAPRPELVFGVEMDQDEAPIRFAFESCERFGARLLVVGTHHKRAPFSLGAGYVVQGLLSHAVTPVAVVPIV